MIIDPKQVEAAEKEPKFEGRLRYLAYRCKSCGRPLTKLEILARWDRMEVEGGKESALCPCGSRMITPTTFKVWEELLYPKIWRLFWKEVSWKDWWKLVVSPWLTKWAKWLRVVKRG